MPKFLWKASYTAEGARGVASRGGVARRDATAHTLESLGGRLEAFYFAFGATDVYIIGELPDEAAAAAASIAVNATGLISSTTIPLLEAEVVDEGLARAVDYRPPGA
jgi:uncharacterized protein with GYD domain